VTWVGCRYEKPDAPDDTRDDLTRGNERVDLDATELARVVDVVSQDAGIGCPTGAKSRRPTGKYNSEVVWLQNQDNDNLKAVNILNTDEF
jgi:hypothetical protein